jgi:hypothetical protein
MSSRLLIWANFSAIGLLSGIICSRNVKHAEDGALWLWKDFHSDQWPKTKGNLSETFPDWLYLHPYQRSCSADRVTQGLRYPALQQKLGPSREAGQRSIRKVKLCFCRFQPKHHLRKICHCQQAIAYISASSCCDLSSPALSLSHSASIVCPLSVSVIQLYPSYQICVICWPCRLGWPSLEINH